MTQEDKELLLKDLCARLPYGVKVEYENEIFNVEHVCPMYEEVKLDIPETWTIGVSEVKPYLLPLSSMDLDQRIEYSRTLVIFDESHCSQTSETYDWYNKNHFDYRGLIPMGLANDATGKNIY